MVIVDHAAGDYNLAHLAIDLVLWLHQTLLDCRRERDDLESRTRLVDVLHRAIRSLLRRNLRRLIGIQRRPIGQRQDFSRLWIHNTSGAFFSLAALDTRRHPLLPT